MSAIFDQIKDLILAHYPADRIILFGSQARGDARPDSDIDLLVLSDAEKNLPRSRRGMAVRSALAKLQVNYEILFFTHEEFTRFQQVPQSFTATVRREGVVLHGS